MVHNPTMVVGIGEAGTKIASDLYDDLNAMYESKPDEDFRDYFGFVGMDTREEDLNDFARRGFQTIRLSPHPDVFEERRSELPYITSDHDFNPSGGATRQRGISRFYIDNNRNYDYMYEQLKDAFTTFDENTPLNGQMNVWIVNSLGGGTGSGAFPLISTIIVEEIAEALDREVWMGGIGSLPRLERLKSSNTPPQGDDQLYANTYTALRELAVLIDYEFEEIEIDCKDYPLSIPFYSNPKNMTSDSWDLDEPPFDFYTVMGIKEDTSGDTLENLNRIAVDTMLFFSEYRGIEDFGGDLFNDKPEVFFSSVTGGHVEVPVDEIRPYLELRSELEEIEAYLTELRRDLNQAKINREFASELIEYAVGDEPAVDLPVSDTVYDPMTGERESLNNRLSNGEDRSPRLTIGIDVTEAWSQIYDAYEFAEQRANNYPGKYAPAVVDSEVDALLDSAVTFNSDVRMSSETVHKYFYYQELLANFREMRSRHEFPELIEEAWSEHESNVRQDIDDLDEVEIQDVELLAEADELSQSEVALRRWEDVLGDYYELRVERAETALDDTWPFQISKRKKLKAVVESREDDETELRNEYDTFQTLHQAVNELSNRREQIERDLNELRSEIDIEIREELLRRYESETERRDTKTSKKQIKEDRLTSPGRSRFAALPIDEFSEFTPDIIDNHDTITELEEMGIINDRDIINTVEYLDQEELDEPLGDRVELVPTERKYTAGLGMDEDLRIPQGDFEADQESVTLDTNEEQFLTVSDPLRLRLIRLFFSVRLENTSEFGKMHELYRETNPVSTEFGFTDPVSDDRFVTNSFAYPELLEEDRDVADYFDLDSVATKE